jgi:hypothetical protein
MTVRIVPVAECAIAFQYGVPQGETTLVNANDYATVRLADGREVTVLGDGRIVVCKAI